jgi:hypothetical protein
MQPILPLKIRLRHVQVIGKPAPQAGTDSGLLQREADALAFSYGSRRRVRVAGRCLSVGVCKQPAGLSGGEPRRRRLDPAPRAGSRCARVLNAKGL